MKNHYTYPAWYWDHRQFPKEPDWPALLAEASRFDKNNKATFQTLKERIRRMIAEVQSIYGDKTKEYKYVSKFYPNAPSSVTDAVERHYKKVLEDQEKAQKAIADEAAKKASVAYQERAILWLTNKRKKLGVDFSLENAISVANDLAFAEAVERAKAEGGPIDFAGQNCDGPCAGWTPGEHRCECGNRRVSFETGYGFSFENPYIYAEAY